MRRVYFYSLLALAIGAGLYLLLGDDPGYVLLSFGTWSVESTLVAMVLFFVLLAVLAYGIYRVVGLLNPVSLFKGDSVFGARRRRRQAAEASEEGLRLLLLGHWQDAYKLLVENADRTSSPAFNYLAASLAAWQRKDTASWNYCLERANSKSAKPNPAIKSLKALLEYRSGKIEQSLAILLALDKEAPGSPYVLAMLKTIYQSVQDWVKLDALLPQLEKHKVVTPEELTELQEKVAIYRLQCVAPETGGLAALETLWDSVDRKVRKGEDITLIYLQKLAEFERHDQALAEMSSWLKHQWSDRIILQAGYLATTEPDRLMVTLEKWLKSRPNNAALMLSLGRVCLCNKLWGKAREYFEGALRLSSSTTLSAQANAELARLLEHMGEHAQSASLYRKAMARLDHELPELPMPE
jgi:HemY protein